MMGTTSAFLINVKEKIDKTNPTILSIMLFLMFFLLPLATYNHTTAGGDMAEYINNPLRVINEDLPYRDFWLLFPPGEVFLPALVYKIFGLNINALLIFSVFISALVGLFSFILGRTIFRENFFAMISAMLVFFSGITYYYTGYIYNHAYFLFLLISAIFFIKYLIHAYPQRLKNVKRKFFIKTGDVNLFLTGVFVGVAFLFRFYQVSAAFLAFLLTIFIHSKFNRKAFGYSIKLIAIFCAGVLLVICVSSLALIDILQPMVKQTIIESVIHGTSINRPYFSDLSPRLRFILSDLKKASEVGNIFYTVFYTIRVFYHLAEFINITFHYLLIFILAGISIWYLSKIRKDDKVIVFFFLLWGILTFPKALAISNMSHLAPSITPMFFLLTFLLKKSVEKFEKDENLKSKFITYVFIVIIIFLLVPAARFFIYAGIELGKPRYEVSTKYGTLLFLNRTEAANVNNVIKFINKNTEEGDYIFVTPWFAPPIYALTSRKNPTYYDSLVDLVLIPSDEKQIKVCNDLLKKNTKLIIHYPGWKIITYYSNLGFDRRKELVFSSSSPILEKCIEDNFKLVKKYGRYWIYVAKRVK